jgi:hypothetical protein
VILYIRAPTTIEDRGLSFARVQYQVSTVIEVSQGTNLSLKSIKGGGEKDHTINKKKHGDQGMRNDTILFNPTDALKNQINCEKCGVYQ